MGTLLCDLSAPPVLFIAGPAPGVPFAVLVPDNPGLVGLTLSSQAASLDAVLAPHFTNALDLAIGTF